MGMLSTLLPIPLQLTVRALQPSRCADPLHYTISCCCVLQRQGKENIELVLQPSGTGQMLTSFDASQSGGQKIDVAVALTEALITGIAKGRTDYSLVGSYVRTSLNWAVITGTSPAAAAYNSIDDLKNTKIGISRIGSGSQIMASVMALQHNWSTSGDHAELEFKVNDTSPNFAMASTAKNPSPLLASCGNGIPPNLTSIQAKSGSSVASPPLGQVGRSLPRKIPPSPPPLLRPELSKC